MVQATFDDRNPETVAHWAYPDTGKWDAERNTREFLAAMPEWRQHGLLAVHAQPAGRQPAGLLEGSAVAQLGLHEPTAACDAEYMARLAARARSSGRTGHGRHPRLLLLRPGRAAEGRGRPCIARDRCGHATGCSTSGYSQRADRGQQRVQRQAYDHAILQAGSRPRADRPREEATERDGRRLLVGHELRRRNRADENVVTRVRLPAAARQRRQRPGPHRARWCRETREGRRAIGRCRSCSTRTITSTSTSRRTTSPPRSREYASWGYFDYRMKGEGFDDGYQSVPVNWGISSPRKRGSSNCSPKSPALGPGPTSSSSWWTTWAFRDLGCYGSEIPTPNLDKLAAGGLRFTQFYNTARCCPTRAALLTGLYSHQAGVGHMIEDEGVPGYRGRLNDHCVTIAEVLQPRRLLHRHDRQMARRPEPRRHAVGARLRSQPERAGGRFLLRRIAPGAKLFLNGEAARQRRSRTAEGLVLHRPLDRLRPEVHRRSPRRRRSRSSSTSRTTRRTSRCRRRPKTSPSSAANTRPAGTSSASSATRKQTRTGLVDKAWPLSPRPDAVKAWDSLTADAAGPLRSHHGDLCRRACITWTQRSAGWSTA